MAVKEGQGREKQTILFEDKLISRSGKKPGWGAATLPILPADWNREAWQAAKIGANNGDLI